MRTPALLCCAVLLVTAGVASGVLCYSTVDCPEDQMFCIQNCTAVAITEFGQPASEGNCRLSLVVGARDVMYGCYIDTCNTSSPEECVASMHEEANGASCCCTEDECNLLFIDSENFVEIIVDDNENITTHIYPSFPNHTTPEQLVCAYQDCNEGEDCVNNFEVCEENPMINSDAVGRLVCVGLFVFDHSANTTHVSKQCFDDAHSNCSEDDCLPAMRSTTNSLSYFSCCCIGNLCNYDIIDNFTITDPPTPTSTRNTTSNSTAVRPSASAAKSESDNERLFVIYGIVGSLMLLIIVILIVMVMVFYCYCQSKMRRTYSVHQHSVKLNNVPLPQAAAKCIDNVELIKQVGRGRFATVWEANLSGRAVAIKVFSMFSMDSWNHERDIYSTPFFEHESLLHFIAADQKTVGYETEYWLVTAYHEYGSLLDFLRARTVNLEDFCVMAESVAAGLAHLHCIFTRNGIYKPAIVHRDFKSKNVLVKNGLSCIISDFGLAVAFASERSAIEAKGQVGTARYMSPEVLEGAVNFQREAFMRIDMYACGLVLWEIASRCVIDGANPGEYMQPFENALKGNPSIEVMKQIVIVDKKRPEFPLPFTLNSQLESLMTTITECWDHDAEARLSAKTVEERIRGLYRDICKPPIIDNEKGAGFIVSLTPSQSMPVLPGKESSSGISCSVPNSQSTLASPRSVTSSPQLLDYNQSVLAESSSPHPLTSSYTNTADCLSVENGHPHVANSNRGGHKHCEALANGQLHSFSESVL